MSKEQKEIDPDAPKKVVPRLDPRIDETVELAFNIMGYKMPYPESLLAVYASVRRKKDMLTPGRLNPDTFATIAVLSDILEGKYSKE